MSIIFRGPTSPRVLAYIPFHELDIIISRAFQKVKQTLGSKKILLLLDTFKYHFCQEA